MRITLDTNVLYQALRDSGGASYRILQLIGERRIELAISVPVYLEYQAVLTRPEALVDLGRTKGEIEAVLRFIAYVGRPTAIYFSMRPNLIDESDNMFVDLAFASQSRFLITSNIADFSRGELRFDSFQVRTPAQFMRLWRKDYE
jgi:putative PIN family toxin of toxin-antitoxin system